MTAIAVLDRVIRYLLLAYAVVLGFSRGGIHTVIILLALLAAVRYALQPVRIRVDADLTRGLAVLFAALLLSTIFSGNPLASARQLVITLFQTLPFFYVLAFVKDRLFIQKAVWLATGSIFFGSLVGIWQGFQGVLRVKSFLGIMDFAGILGLIIPLLLVQVLTAGEKPRGYRYLLLVIIVAAIMALGFNETRAVWISVAIVVVLLAGLLTKLNNRRALLPLAGLGAVVAIVLAAVVYSDPKILARVYSIFDLSVNISNVERIIMWRYGWQTFLAHPLLGVGLANLPTCIYPWEAPPAVITYGHIHNNFLQMLAENGIVGFGAFCFLFGTILRTAWRRLKLPQTRDWAMIALLCTVEFLIHGLFDYTFNIATVIYTYWYLLGLAYASYHLAAPDGGNS